MHHIITTYLSKNILVIFFAIFFIVAFLIIGNAFTSVLKSSLDQNLDISSVFSLVLIQSLKDIPIILTLTFFIAIIVAINKMYKESEIYAINSAGVGELKILQYIAPLVTTIAGVSFYISMFLVPHSGVIKEQILQKNANTGEFHFIKTGEFQEFQNGNITLYAKGSPTGSLGNIFLYSQENNNKNIILAEDGMRYQDSANNVYVRLTNGVKYDGFLATNEKKIFEFATMDVKIFNKNTLATPIQFNTESQPLSTLLDNLTPQHKAEIWWRISLPIAIILLAIIGVFLAKTPPRGGKNLNVLYGVIIFALYLNLLKSYKDNIAHNSEITAMLIPHIIFILLAILLYFKNNGFNRA
jgi:lipopolysaccharide export system permease protein